MARGVAHTTRELTLPAPYDADRLFAFLASRAIPGVESVDRHGDGWRYGRSLRLTGGVGAGTLITGGDRVTITARARTEHEAVLVAAMLERVLDLDADPASVDGELARHAAIRPLVRQRPGLRVPRAADRDEVAFRAVVGQQVSVPAASTTCGVIAAAHGDALPAWLRAPGVEWLWPTNDTLAALDPAMLPMPRAKAAALAGLAAALADRAVDLSAPASDVRRQLVALKGIGPWTAGYVSMRACGDHDVLLDGDLIVRRGAALVGLPANPRELRAAAEILSPWRSYLTMHLWQAYAARDA